MALSLARRTKSYPFCLQPFRSLEANLPELSQRFKWSFTEEVDRAPFSSDAGASFCSVDVSKWRKIDSRIVGVVRSKISVPSWKVVKNLRDAGFQAYLVGGCVRDMILNKVPKDFDVITTASLKQVKKKFRKATIVGRRFPICMVTEKGSIIEVSSFETATRESKMRKFDMYKIPKGCNQTDFVRWKNCIERDFTVNSLLFDPFVNIIYDYTNAMKDLKSRKLRTVIPANLSFKEDQARILRGLRLAARLNLSFSKETEDALYSLSSSISDLSTSRLNMEMNYMLSYGAAESSLLLLTRFKVLEILFPFHAAYLSEQVNNQIGLQSSMFMKLFFHLDQLFTCNQPCPSSVWIAIMALHHAIFTNSQHAVVLWTFGLLLHNRTWEESIKIAREKATSTRIYVPEILDTFDHLSDDDIIKGVTKYAKQVEKSVDILVKKDCLLKSMSRFSQSGCSGLVLVPPKSGERVKCIFKTTADGVDSVEAKEWSREINHFLLKKGDLSETKFVLGIILMRTLVEKNEPAERESMKAEIDDTQVTNPPQKSEPKSAHPTMKNQLSITCGETGTVNLDVSTTDKILNDEMKSDRRLLSSLF